MQFRLITVEQDVKIIKIDVEKVRENVEDIITQNSETLAKMVTQKEHRQLEQ